MVKVKVSLSGKEAMTEENKTQILKLLMKDRKKGRYVEIRFVETLNKAK